MVDEFLMAVVLPFLGVHACVYVDFIFDHKCYCIHF